MYCPNCGKETSVDLNFCRACGLGLEKIAQSLADQFPTTLDQNQQQLKEKFQRKGMIALSIFGLGILSMFLYGVVYKVMIVQGRVFEGAVLLLLMTLVSSGLFAVYQFAKANEIGEASKKRREIGANETPTSKLISEGYLEPVPGVTERTTDLLLVERKASTKEI
jgi:hypothetical protein